MSELPEGWAECRLRDLLQAERGIFDGPFGSSLKTADYIDQGVRVIRLENVATYEFIDSKRAWISPNKFEQLRRHEVLPGDLIVGSFVDDRVRVCLLPTLDTPAIAKADCFCLRPRSEMVDRRFLMYQLGLSTTRDALVSDIHGATRPRVTTAQLKELTLVLPPLAEQRRIVEKVEALFTHTRRAAAALSAVDVSQLRGAIIAAACAGTLTTDFRSLKTDAALDITGQFTEEMRGRTPSDWPLVRFADLCEHMTSGSRAWKPYYSETGYGTFVMAQNVRPMAFDRSHRQGVAPPPNDPELRRTLVAENDLLITIVGANTGDVCRVDSHVVDHFVCQSVALARPKSVRLARFLELWLNSRLHGRAQFETWIYGEGRPHLSFDHLRETVVALPSEGEQEEIVRRVDNLLALIAQIGLRLSREQERVARLEASILAKAFAGELVPNEAELARREGRSYEPASVLLERIRAERGSAPAAPKRRR